MDFPIDRKRNREIFANMSRYDEINDGRFVRVAARFTSRSSHNRKSALFPHEPSSFFQAKALIPRMLRRLLFKTRKTTTTINTNSTSRHPSCVCRPMVSYSYEAALLPSGKTSLILFL